MPGTLAYLAVASLAAALLLPAASAELAVESKSYDQLKALMLLTNETTGERIGYQYGDKTPVYFDQLAETGDQIDMVVQHSFQVGKELGNQQACSQNQTELKVDLIDRMTALNDATDLTYSVAVTDLEQLIIKEEKARIADKIELSQRINDVYNNITKDLAPIHAQLGAAQARLTILENVTVSSTGGSGSPAAAAGFGETRWLSLENPDADSDSGAVVHAKAFSATPILIHGVGFSEYYHPSSGSRPANPDSFYKDVACIFTNTASGAKVNSFGEIRHLDTEQFFFVQCLLPDTTGPGVYTVQLFDLQQKLVPFRGLAGRNQLTVVHEWTSIATETEGSVVHVYGSGFDNQTPLAYEVTATSTDKKKTQTLTCAPKSSTELVCTGKFSGFPSKAGVDEIDATVRVQEKVSKHEVIFAGDSRVGAGVAQDVTIAQCWNQIKEATESGIDCGGASACRRCVHKQQCALGSDCSSGVCKNGLCFEGDGSTSADAGENCYTIKKYYPSMTGFVKRWVRGLNNLKSQPIQVWCEMSRQGGGWTLMLESWYQGNSYSAVAQNEDFPDRGFTERKANRYKLADDFINNGLVGPSRTFDVMGDQNNYNPRYSRGNYEYVVVRNYKADFTWIRLTGQSETTTNFTSYRIVDDAVAWEGNLYCGNHPSAAVSTAAKGINCYGLAPFGGATTVNPQGGAGCKINMGTSSHPTWHNFFMSNSNSDTYLYICNGAQHSSSYDISHRWWFRQAIDYDV